MYVLPMYVYILCIYFVCMYVSTYIQHFTFTVSVKHLSPSQMRYLYPVSRNEDNSAVQTKLLLSAPWRGIWASWTYGPKCPWGECPHSLARREQAYRTYLTGGWLGHHRRSGSFGRIEKDPTSTENRIPILSCPALSIVPATTELSQPQLISDRHAAPMHVPACRRETRCRCGLSYASQLWGWYKCGVGRSLQTAVTTRLQLESRLVMGYS